jgi:hypothetical protein
VAKRSPILGYNHNVRYRGLVFHVQTEDSGVLSPHLFTHLFHEGVIVSTRKLVYDAGASEDAIKALMQAQHKAVLKDLKLHTFDDKIDQYLGQTPGLEPRRTSEPIAAVAAVAAPPPVETPEPAAPEAITTPEPTPPLIEIVRDDLVATAPTRQMDEATKEVLAREAAAEAVRDAAARVTAAQEAAREEPEGSRTQTARTQTADRTSRASQFRSIPPPQPDAVPVELNAGPTVPTSAPDPMPGAGPPSQASPPPPPARAMRAATPPPIPSRSRSNIVLNVDSSPEIEIIPGDEESGRRNTRDTDIDAMIESGVPAAVADDQTRPSDTVPPQHRPASHGAATLPAAVRPPSRPSITPAQVVSRPLPPEQRNRENTDAIEVYAPAPASVELPAGERGGSAADRPASGQYSMTRRDQPANRVAIPAGLGRPRTPVAGSPTMPRPPSTDGRTKQPSETGPIARQRQQSDGVPTIERPGSTSAAPPIEKARPGVTAPIATRPTTASPQGNVVMTRPAVIVGAPQKPPGAPVTGRIRKAREDEGRGFGQGLISEKSLDEVILAYLSEDAEEK